MKSNSLYEQLGQLFIIGFEGESTGVDHPVLEDINCRNLGGVILFDRLLAKRKSTNNIINPEQVQTLISTLQKAAGHNLLVGIDQEGGKVSRLPTGSGFCPTPSAEELGEDGSYKTTKKNAAMTAHMLEDLGLNLNFAPVVDLNIFPENPIIAKYKRSFGQNSDTVIAHAEVWIAEHRKRGIISCLKHFPGHGSSRTDSHSGFVDITPHWSREELLPYQKLIERGSAQTIMVGHLYHRDFDPKLPATLSGTFLEKEIRKKLNYDGVLLSDDMQMKAITEQYGLEEACCMALAAGIDILIIGNNLEHDPHILSKLLKSVRQAIERGKISRRAIEKSLSRIQKLKKQLRENQCLKTQSPPIQPS